ncbi:uncharacterized protein EV422DRAFT_508278 [Fimicolochytrium jonesii]|uniref:uncharacterized protein n=1 Tax=Fimicolochytrium jonesii TaxID=1396493 RepID=UPI0022FF0E9E|nr:uncharacterized protein EV422DRAFT_508278 [Fimicolochytrium jonesii]KAI8818418.1 hypothetical protein EV422DRAFT_508278 [Fimicolochytrium jonesii]
MDVQVPVEEDELATFRQRWQQELHKEKPVPTTLPSTTSSTSSNSPARQVTAAASPASPSKQPAATTAAHRQPLAQLQPKVGQSPAAAERQLVKTDNEAARPTPTGGLAGADGSHSERGLAAYVEATKHERMGDLSAAMKKYREAHRLDPEVEKKYRAILQQPSHPFHKQQKALPDPNASLYTYYDFHEVAHADDSKSSQSDSGTLAKALQRMDIQFIPHNENRKSPFHRLPSEVVSHIIQWAILLQGQSISCSLSLVSKKMCVLVAEQSVWRAVCEKVHGPLANPDIPLSSELPLYRDSWMDMWLDRPRIRRDGVYISRMNYVRQGEGQGFYAPVHLVTYYRYLRFHRDRVSFWTTTVDPAAALKILAADEVKQKGYMLGEYTLEGKDVFLHMRSSERVGTFRAHLTLTQSRRGRQNKLVWVAYWQEKTGGFKSEIPTKTLRSFIFSKVNSYPRSLI